MTSLDTEPHRARLDSLTGLRFYAAFAVILRHAVPEMYPAPVLTQLAAIGPVGVGFFFTLSGFILTWTWNPNLSPRTFYGRRLARIYPLHVLTTVIAVVITLVMGLPNVVNALRSLLLLHAWGGEEWAPGTNGPSWSLSVEAFFYLLAPFLIPLILKLDSRKCLWLILGTLGIMVFWTGAYAAASIADLPVNALSTYTNPLYRLSEFAIGIAVASAMRRGWRMPINFRLALMLAGAGYGGLAVVNWVVAEFGPSLGGTRGLPLGILDLLYLPFTCLLISTAAGSDLAGQRTPVAGVWHVRLGQWSFALYLAQMIIIVTIAELLPTTSALSTLGLVTLVTTIAACIAASAALFYWVEKPMERLLRSAIGQDRASDRTRLFNAKDADAEAHQ